MNITLAFLSALLAVLLAITPVMAKEDALVAHVAAAVQRNHLSSLKPECISYSVSPSDKAGYDSIAVREVHSQLCGGDTETAPIIMWVTANRKTGKLTYSDPISGEDKPLK